MSEPAIALTVCTTCRAGRALEDGIPVQGRMLHERLAMLLGDDTDGIRISGVECLAVCNDGCAAAISTPGKWSYLLGRLTPDKAEDLVVFARAYGRSGTGTVMPSKRPASLADMILGRIPS